LAGARFVLPGIPDKCCLLDGTYQVPALHVGDRADCRMRGTVVLMSWTDARIPWPRCKRQGKSHPSLLLDDEPARAVRTEAVVGTTDHYSGFARVLSRSGLRTKTDRVNSSETFSRPTRAPE
jgi:hypothetical protein